MEFFGTAAAVASLVVESIDLVQRVSTALDSYKNITESLAPLLDDLFGVQLVLELVRDKPELQSSGVANAVSSLKKVAEETEIHARKIQVKTRQGTQTTRVARALVKGPKDQDKLEEQVNKLTSSKVTLCLHIQVALVGLCHVCQKGSADAVPAIKHDVVTEVNQEVEKRLGNGQGLKIVEFIRDKVADADGLVFLSREDYDRLLHLEIAVQRATTNIKNNAASQFAMQVNETVDDELLDRERNYNLNIEDNKANDFATQINTPIVTRTFNGLREDRLRLALGAAGQQNLWNQPTPPMPFPTMMSGGPPQVTNSATTDQAPFSQMQSQQMQFQMWQQWMQMMPQGGFTAGQSTQQDGNRMAQD